MSDLTPIEVTAGISRKAMAFLRSNGNAPAVSDGTLETPVIATPYRRLSILTDRNGNIRLRDLSLIGKKADVELIHLEREQAQTLMQKLRTLLRDNGGQAIAEAALLIPVFVLLSFVLIDIQWLIKDATDVDYIATETARCEAINSGACLAPFSPQSYALKLAQDVHLSTGPELQVATPACSASSCTTEISYRYQPLGAWFPAITIVRFGTAAVAPQQVGP